MKASKFSDAQKAFIIKQGEEGTPVSEICRQAGISQATYFNWKKKYAGLLPTEMKRLKQLEDENGRLKSWRDQQTVPRGLLKKLWIADSLAPKDVGGLGMLGRKERDQLELVVAGSLRDILPEDHVLVRVDSVLDLSWLRGEVADHYCPDNGRPGIDPEGEADEDDDPGDHRPAERAADAGGLVSHGIVQDRRLMRGEARPATGSRGEAERVNLAIRWFIGQGLHGALPDHSSLTRIRQCWGEATFRRIFTRVVRLCQAAGLVTLETVHMDASLIRADVSMDALVARHLDAVDEANDVERTARSGGKYKKLCATDPDATMATSSRAPLRPAYKQHTAVDDRAGVVVDVTPQACLRHDEIVTGEEHDTGRFEERLEVMENTLGAAPARVTADAAYGVGKVYTALETRQTDAVIPPAKVTRRKGAQGFPTDRFKYDPHHDVVRCPARRRLTPRNATKSGRWYRADRRDCARCPLKAQCLPKGAPSRRVHIVTNHAAILRARRKRAAWGEEEYAIYARHRWRVEGTHGTAKTLHGLARAIRRGLDNMKIQALLTAIAMNLKKLANAALRVIRVILEIGAARSAPKTA